MISLTHARTHTHALIHTLTHTRTYTHMHSLTHVHMHSLTHSLTHSHSQEEYGLDYIVFCWFKNDKSKADIVQVDTRLVMIK